MDPMKDMERWLGNGGMKIIGAIGASFDAYGVEVDSGLEMGWVKGNWAPTDMACNPHGIVQAGVHSVVLDAAMNFAANAGLNGSDRTRATLEMKTETMRVARTGDQLTVRGSVTRLAKQVAYVEAKVEDAQDRIVSRSTGTFLLYRGED